MMRVLLLVGSSRDDGFNQRLADTARATLREYMTVDTFADLASLPHLREDLDESGRDEVVDAFRLAVRKADALLLVTPEYNGGPPSLIKNALDHASRPREDIPIAGKPSAVIGATPSRGATAGAREALVRGLRVAGAAPIAESYGIGTAFRHLVDDGYDDETQAGVRVVIESLLTALHA